MSLPIKTYRSSHVTKEQIEGVNNHFNILSKLMGGVHNHLDYPLRERRYLGMKVSRFLLQFLSSFQVGEEFSRILNPENPLKFEYDEEPLKDKDHDENTTTMNTTTTTTTTTANALEANNGNRDNLGNITTPQSLIQQHYSPSPNITATRGTIRKLVVSSSSSSSESSESDPDRPFFSKKKEDSESESFEDGNNKGDSSKSSSNSESESDSDSLEPLNLDDDTSDLKKTKTPVYIRECLTGLRSDEPDEILATLSVITGLVRKEPGEKSLGRLL